MKNIITARLIHMSATTDKVEYSTYVDKVREKIDEINNYVGSIYADRTGQNFNGIKEDNFLKWLNMPEQKDIKQNVNEISSITDELSNNNRILDIYNHYEELYNKANDYESEMDDQVNKTLHEKYPELYSSSGSIDNQHINEFKQIRNKLQQEYEQQNPRPDYPSDNNLNDAVDTYIRQLDDLFNNIKASV